MLTTESALIVPVPEAETIVRDLRVRYDPGASVGIPSHITLLYPFVDPEALDESTLEELVAIFAGVNPFPFDLTEIAQFSEVVYLAPDPAGRFSRLTAAIATRWPATQPYGGVYDDVIPHLTVAHASVAPVIEEIRARVETTLPVSCTADQAWLMIGGAGGWSLQHRFPFEGTGRRVSLRN